MARLSDIFVTAVFVADEFARNPHKKVVDLAEVLRRNYANYEVVVIDNGINAKDRKLIVDLLDSVPCIRVVRLSRTQDTDTAVFAGVEASIGDVVCILYNQDPVKELPKFVSKVKQHDIVFGIAQNLQRRTRLEVVGAKAFYWYSRRYQKIDIPKGATYYMGMNRNAANALTRSGRFMRHIRHMAHRVGFTSTNHNYKLPKGHETYSYAKPSALFARGLDIISNYSNQPLRALSYAGVFAGLLNIIYAVYVMIVNLADGDHIARGWTTLSLQSSLMFFILFMILAILAEYIGKILNESQQEPPYHIMQELSSTISVADETRRNVTK